MKTHEILNDRAKVIRGLNCRIAAALAQYGLSKAQWTVLGFIHDNPGINSVGLARITDTKLSNIRGRTREMLGVQIGRKSSGNDGRAQFFYCTLSESEFEAIDEAVSQVIDNYGDTNNG